MVLNDSIEIPPGLELINEVFTNEVGEYNLLSVRFDGGHRRVGPGRKKKSTPLNTHLPKSS